MMIALPTMGLLALLGPACWFDVRERRIPNAVTVAGALLGLLLRLTLGVGPVVDGLLGAGLALLVALTPFALGVLGGGDVKLLAAVGAFFGVERLFGGLLLIAAMGGALAIVEAVRRRALMSTLAGTINLGKQWLLFGRPTGAAVNESSEPMSIPYGVAIASGSLVWWFLGGATL